MDWKIELVPLSVTDVDRAVAFYRRIGWSIDHDQVVGEGLRFVQVTPPGSACSVCFGVGLGMFPDDHRQHIQVVVAKAEEARDHLRQHGVECSDVDEQPWGRFVTMNDPDGNRWTFQELVSYS